MDARSKRKPWTREYLEVIDARRAGQHEPGLSRWVSFDGSPAR